MAAGAGVSGGGGAAAGAAPPAAMCIVPHAGWVFSGRLAAKTLKEAGAALGPDGPEAVAVLGGHLGPGSAGAWYPEDAWETPHGDLPLLTDLARGLSGGGGPGGVRLRRWDGPTQDNTVEVELPLVKALFPEAEALALRLPADPGSAETGLAILKLLEGRRALIVASTDLTHYGAAYGFAPAGPGPAGERFRDENDRLFIEAALAMDPDAVINAGEGRRAACSAGAAAAVAAAASALGLRSRLVDHYASTDVMPGDQSVGYAGIVYSL
jgi:AmmeMemoRadiSam system protein B